MIIIIVIFSTNEWMSSIYESKPDCGDHGHIFSLPSHWYIQPLNNT